MLEKVRRFLSRADHDFLSVLNFRIWEAWKLFLIHLTYGVWWVSFRLCEFCVFWGVERIFCSVRIRFVWVSEVSNLLFSFIFKTHWIFVNLSFFSNLRVWDLLWVCIRMWEFCFLIENENFFSSRILNAWVSEKTNLQFYF